MFGQISNWLSTNINQIQNTFKNEQNKEEENVTSDAAATAASVADDGVVITKQDADNATEKAVTSENTASATATTETAETTEKQHDDSSINILNIDKEKALGAAKEIGSLFLSFGKTATKQLQEKASQFKDVLEKNTIIGDFSKENEKFVNEKKVQQRREDAAVAPWVGYHEEEKLKEQILLLSTDSRNFCRNPPAGVEFHFEFNQSYPIALATLEEDPNLKEMRFNLVPKKISEELFWRNYFYRVSLIKQSIQLNQMVNQQELFDSKSSTESDNINEKKESKTSVSETLLDVTPSDANTQNNEFVSDSYETSINEEEIKREMKQLKLDSSNNKNNNTDDIEDQDWDKELNDDIDNITAEELEKEISEMIEGEISTSKN